MTSGPARHRNPSSLTLLAVILVFSGIVPRQSWGDGLLSTSNSGPGTISGGEVQVEQGGSAGRGSVGGRGASPVEVRRTGRGDRALDRRLDALLEGGDYLLVTADTLIARGETIPHSILVLGSTLILEGRVEGDLIGVGANLFIRPSGRISGDLINLAGGLYPSALAEIDGSTVDRPLAPYRVNRAEGTWVIEGVARRGHIVLDGFKGFHIPTYQRVDALGVRWGATYLTSPEPVDQTRLHGWVGYLSGRGDLEGGAEVSREFGSTRLSLGVEEATATNDRWIRGDLKNSFSFLQDGDDYRNYYLRRRAYLAATRRLGHDRRRIDFSLIGQLERDRSLRRVSAWTVIGGSESRVNPEIDRGNIAGLTLHAEGRWVGRSLAVNGWTSLETAGHLLAGDFSFNRFAIFGDFGMDALANHALLVRWYFQAPVFGSSALPRQRWSILGGNGTLPPYDIGEFDGDRVAFVESRYVVPLPSQLELPVLGRPDLELAHGIGNAWGEGEGARLFQSLEARVQYSIIYVYLATDPAHTSGNTRASVGLSLPFGDRYPWRAGGGS